MLTGGHRLHDHGADVFHHLGVSAFATHAVVDERSAVRVDRDIPPEIAALFGCAVLTGVGAAVNSAKVRPGESVVVYGLGGVGLAALLGALASGAQPVIAVDPVAAKRDLALDLGAAAAVAPDEAAAAVKALTGRGADVAIETVGKAAVLAEAYKVTRRGGRTVTVGLPNPAEMLSISAVQPRRRRQDADGQLHGLGDPAPRYPALHCLVEGGAPASRAAANVDRAAVRDQCRARRARERTRNPPNSRAMSVAFTKEGDAEAVAADLPDRPISTHPNLVTASGLAQLDAELRGRANRIRRRAGRGWHRRRPDGDGACDA